MKLKDRLDKVFDVKSYGYVVDKWFLRSAFLIMILLFLVVVRVDGWDVAVRGSQYVECADPFGCVNPFYDPVVDAYSFDGYFMRDGDSWGVLPSRLARLFPYLCVGLFALALLLNHLIYNRNFKVK